MIRVRRSSIRLLADGSLACLLTVSANDATARGWSVIRPPVISPDYQQAADHAARLATEVNAGSVFNFWHRLREALYHWRDANEKPPEAAAFGLALIERALVDAFCRAQGKPFALALRDGDFRIDLGKLCKPLAGRTPNELLPHPTEQLSIQYSLSPDSPEMGAALAADFTQFNIGLSGNVDQDIARLKYSAGKLAPLDRYSVSLEGNSAFRKPADLRALWNSLIADPALKKFTRSVTFIEQPFAADATLENPVVALFAEWPERPPILIDEAAASLEALARALEWGYAGMVYRAEKGIIPGIVDACLLGARMEREPVGKWTLASALSSNLPLALPAELAIAGALGLTSVIAPAVLFNGISLPDGFTNPVQHEGGVLNLDGEINRVSLGSDYELVF